MNFNRSFLNVELHTHLDGSFKAETILKVGQRRNIQVAYSNAHDMNNYLIATSKKTLREFLIPFNVVVPIFAGDKEDFYGGALRSLIVNQMLMNVSALGNFYGGALRSLLIRFSVLTLIIYIYRLVFRRP